MGSRVRRAVWDAIGAPYHRPAEPGHDPNNLCYTHHPYSVQYRYNLSAIDTTIDTTHPTQTTSIIMLVDRISSPGSIRAFGTCATTEHSARLCYIWHNPRRRY